MLLDVGTTLILFGIWVTLFGIFRKLDLIAAALVVMAYPDDEEYEDEDE